MRDGTLLAPCALGPLRLRNRVIGAPMERNLCTPAGRVTEAYVSYLRARARGGVGLLYTEAAYVRADGRGRARQLGVHDDGVIEGLAAAADAVHAEGGLLGVELNHGGRTTQSRVSGHRPVAPSPVPCAVTGGELPRALDLDDIADLLDCFAAAARRCVAAGVDALTIHGAHGYLVHQFLSPRTNLRDDAYGDRGRFLRDVIVAVRDAAPSVALGLRLSALEGPPDGLDADETHRLIAAAPLDRLDFLDVSAGSYEAGEWTVQPGEWPEGVLAEHAARYRALGLPVAVAGRISRRATAERLLARGQADLVSVARALHADPAWALGGTGGGAARPCIACNVCIDALGVEEPIPCSVNPEVGREDAAARIVPATDRRRVDVVGAGPAGLEAAVTLAGLGHRVRLLERDAAIGGELRLAASLRGSPEFGRLPAWYAERLAQLGVEQRVGVAVGADALLDDPADAVVDATGGAAVLPAVPGIDLPHVHEIRAWLRAGAPDLGDGAHVVWGADREGVAVADELAARGTRLTLVGEQHALAPEAGRRAKVLVVPRLERCAGVSIELGARVRAIAPGLVTIARGEVDGRVEHDGPVLVSQGVTTTRRTLRAGLEAGGHPGRLVAAGGATGRGDAIAMAVADGRRVAYRLHAALTEETNGWETE